MVDLQFVIECIDSEGVVHTPLADRLESPRTGDIVRFRDGSNGRLSEYVDGIGFKVCCEMGSAFMARSGVRVSGGPFVFADHDELTAAHETMTAVYWNWGNNLAREGNGILYRIDRPVFLLDEDNPKNCEVNNGY